jgi:DNA-binding CsgD family transcriptional regulator
MSSPAAKLGLTARQGEIAERVSREAENKEIASELNCSLSTVKASLEKMVLILRVRGRVGIALAWRGLWPDGQAVRPGLKTIRRSSRAGGKLRA